MRDRGAFHRADTTGGWRNHYWRMKRWKDRSLGTARVVNLVSSEMAGDGLDFFLAYCLWAHSLLDWLRQDGVSEEPNVREYLYTQPFWDVCRSIANRSRHFDQTHNPVPKDKYWCLKRASGGFLDQVNKQDTYEWIVWYDKERMTVSYVVQEIDRMWDEALKTYKLDPAQKPEELWNV